MSLLQKKIMETPLKNVFDLYNKEVVPRLTKKNKVIGISAAVIISLVYLIREKVVKPPKKLRHIPYISFFNQVSALFKGESLWSRTYRMYLPKTYSPENKGLYMVNLIHKTSCLDLKNSCYI